jgi:CheY-like chemotaxis protein
VITAYSGAEAIETVERFPDIDGAVLDAGVRDMPLAEVARGIKQLQPKMPVVVICSPGGVACPEADYHLDFFDPEALLKLLQGLFPEASAEIRARDQQLSAEEER